MANGLIDNLVAKIYYAFIVVGVGLTFFTLGAKSKATMTGTIVGYSFIVAGLFMMIAVSMSKMFGPTNLSKNGVSEFLYTIGPFLLIIATISFLLHILSQHYDAITSGHVPNGYYNFSNIVVVLIIAQLAVYYNGTLQQGYKETFALSKVISLMIYLLGLINLLSVITIWILLTYFSTDG